MKTNNNQRGFIIKIILLIVAIIALKYFFHFDIIEWIKSPKVQETIKPFVTILKNIYDWLDNFVRGIIHK
ncbi:MAG TPA: hypothetical protein VJC13_03665 [Candidatus Paceibacterota bacterium]